MFNLRQSISRSEHFKKSWSEWWQIRSRWKSSSNTFKWI